ncbi:hypothetical protein RHS04_08153 [Rhizoctonia solani]|uniref:F-box domain-containing protein n=1 Tax=Rhizoctonia solani TaxID=456999 RepID=A0A8H7LJJ1_9AGAM|nr:hypothetical protein RHS04_08153 [Rhizoctonia solani]
MNTSTVARSENSNHAQGGLGSLVALPVEVLVQILTYLQPAELMTLARLSKQLRTMLMDPNSRFIWQKVISNFPGLPPCPRDVSEPKYVSLLFSETCSSCGTSSTVPMDPYIMARLCHTCQGTGRVLLSLPARDNDELEWYTHSAYATLQEHRETAQLSHSSVPEVMHLREGVIAYAICGASGNWVRRDGIVLSLDRYEEAQTISKFMVAHGLRPDQEANIPSTVEVMIYYD